MRRWTHTIMLLLLVLSVCCSCSNNTDKAPNAAVQAEKIECEKRKGSPGTDHHGEEMQVITTDRGDGKIIPKPKRGKKGKKNAKDVHDNDHTDAL